MTTKNSKQLMLCPNCHLFVPLDDECSLCGFKLKPELTDSSLTDCFKNFFKPDNYINWDLQFIPIACKRRLESCYNDFFEISISKLTYEDGIYFYYFSKKHKSRPFLILIFNENPKKSNFRLYKNELLVFLKINHNLDVFKDNFSLRYASKNKDSNIYYISLGDMGGSDIIKKLDLLADFSKFISNPLLGNFEFNEISKPKNKPAFNNTRVEYNNGYVVKEGMSISGKKQRKGSFKRRNNNEGEGFVIPKRISYHDYER
ncbi:hypothetical protein [uncultured Methanobrevibacter sp.]|uniref:hypothetical protein n=1 Tax=uncultured Methanobrevibacter sp. TaxID=253161 RepID=UPI0026265A3F|nr:hypothetical protein [uncultured Methanobrevibacter sp.]